MERAVEFLNSLIWGAPALVLILGAGLYLSFRTGFVQITLFRRAFRMFWSKLCSRHPESGVSPFQALCTALAATIGTGNIAGVAGAIALGGPGAIFWMWLCALVGMMTKFAEATLAVYYRRRQHGEWVGGPMYMISHGMSKKWGFLAYLYCIFGVFAAFGVGNATQINAVVTGLNQVIAGFGAETTFRRNLGIGLLLAVPVGLTLIGGAKRIGAAAGLLVPLAAGLYLILCAGVLIFRFREIPRAFAAIIQGAFSPAAFTGGMVGSCFQSLRIGVSRGVFTNEAGMGTASMAHASAEVEHPAQQGLMGIMEVFLDTIVICTMTALVILCSGIEIPYGADNGASLTTAAFTRVYGGWVSIPLAISLCLFAVASILGWGLYGGRCLQYLFGEKAWKPFVILQSAVVVVGACLQTGTIWLLAEIVNALMAIPNLTALVLLCPELVRLVEGYRNRQ